MVLGALVAALAAYLFQLVTARVIGSYGYAPLSVLWTLQYLLMGIVLYSVEAWALRSVRLAGGDTAALRTRIPALLGQLAVLAALLGAVAWWWREPLFHGAGGPAAVVSLMVGTYTAFVLSRAVLAGRQRYAAYGAVTASESVLRLVLAVAVLAAGGRAGAIALIMPLGALGAAGSVLLLRRRRPPATTWAGRTCPPAGADEPAPTDGSGRFLLATVPANACNQLLLAGGPLVLVGLGARPETVSTFFVAVTAARLPLVIAQGGLLSRLLPTFTEMVRRGRAARLGTVAVKVALGGLGAAALAGAAAAVAGPAVLALLFGSGFRPSAWLAAVAMSGVTLAAASLVLNQIVIACRRESRLVPPWLFGLAVATAVIVLAPGTGEARVEAAFVAGQITALIGLTVTAVRQTAGASAPLD